MLLTCVSVVNAQNSTEKIQFTGTLINPVTSVKDYRIRVYTVGKDKLILEECRPAEDGSFSIAAYSDKAVRLEVLDKKKKTVFCRIFFGSEGNHKLELNDIDLSKDKKDKAPTNQ